MVLLVILAPIVFAIVAGVLVLKLAAGLVRAVFAFALFLAALLRIHHEEATLFSVLPSQRRVHETYIGRVYDAVITQVHAIENVADASALKPERVEIEGSRLAGIINLTNYTAEEQALLMEA